MNIFLKLHILNKNKFDLKSKKNVPGFAFSYAEVREKNESYKEFFTKIYASA